MSESTTIDQLEIEISSNSSGAAAGIEALSNSLGKLKQNGTVGVAVKNLNNLTSALRAFTMVQSPSHKINALTSGLQALKGVGSVTSIANSLTKLGTALKSVGGMDTGGLDMKILGISSAVRPLSEVKSGGLSTMVNAMGKLGKVTESLDDETIGRFAEKVEKLNKVLEPLSTKMTTIQSGLRGINSKARSAAGGVRELGEDVNTTTLNMASMITVIRGVVDALRPVVEVLTQAIGAAIEWDGVAARFGRGFGESAPEVYAWIQRLNEEMGINVQQFMQYSSVYATMLTGFGVAMEDAGKMALGYTELTYDIWAGYNDVYKSFDEAAEAVKSAIAGEVEPVRRAGFTIIESTLQQTAANHGLEISLANATEAQKSYLRYLTLVDQAYAQGLVGTYAKELNTAEGLMRTFSQQLKSLAQAFGSLFLPILVRVMPWLQAFVSLLTEAVYWLAGLFGIEIQPVDWSGIGAGAGAIGAVAESADDATGALGNAAKAAKELKNATLGIDELNVISPPASSSAGSGGSGGAGGVGGGFSDLDIDSLWDESIFDQIQSQVEQIKSKIKGLLPIVGGIAAAFAGWKILDLLDNLDDADKKLGKLKPTIEGLAKGLAVVGITVAVGKLVWDFTGAYLESGNLGDLAKMLGTTVLGTALAAWLAGPMGAGIVLAASGIVSLVRLGIELKEGSVEITDPQALVTALVGTLETILGGALVTDAIRGGPWVKAIGSAISAGLTSAFGTTSLSGIASSLLGSLSSALSALPALLASIPVWGWIAAAVVALIGGGIALAVADYDFTDIGYKIGNAIGSALKKAKQWITDVGGAILDGLKSAFDWVMKTFDFNSVWELIYTIFNPVSWITKIVPKMIEIGAEVLPGLWAGIKSGWNNMISNIKEFINGFVQGFKDGLGIASPSKVFKEIGKLCMDGLMSALGVKAIQDRVSEMWSKAKEWWDKKKAALKEYTPTIGSIYEKLKERWDNARDWYNNKKAKLKEYTPTIGSIYEKVKERWDNAREWYNNKKSKMKQYTPAIGSIYEKVKERWDNAREWYNNKKSAMATYTPSIGSIKDKLVSAWNTAKDWWNKNVRLTIPSLSFKVTYNSSGLNAVQKAVVKALSLPGWPKLSFAANGGLFDQGSMIWAGERGAEIVANAAGGKTGVMNVQQMQDAVYDGVYAAVVAAMRATGGNGSQAVNVYLDSRQITATVEQRQHERGVSIMGNQVLARSY